MTDAARLATILDRIERVREYLRGGRAQFMESRLHQDAVVRNLEVIGEAAKALSPALRRAHPEVPWRRLAGLRDVAIHQYDSLRTEDLWQAGTVELPRIREAVARITVDGPKDGR